MVSVLFGCLVKIVTCFMVDSLAKTITISFLVDGLIKDRLIRLLVLQFSEDTVNDFSLG